jgi:hypothetical protein
MGADDETLSQMQKYELEAGQIGLSFLSLVIQ